MYKLIFQVKFLVKKWGSFIRAYLNYYENREHLKLKAYVVESQLVFESDHFYNFKVDFLATNYSLVQWVTETVSDSFASKHSTRCIDIIMASKFTNGII